MRILKNTTFAASAAALVLAPVAVSATPASQALSVSNALPQRAAVVNEDESKANGVIIGLVVAAMFIIGIIVLAGDDDDESASA